MAHGGVARGVGEWRAVVWACGVVARGGGGARRWWRGVGVVVCGGVVWVSGARWCGARWCGARWCGGARWQACLKLNKIKATRLSGFLCVWI